MSCQTVLKSGAKKGSVCGRANCKMHKSLHDISAQIEEVLVQIEEVQVPIKEVPVQIKEVPVQIEELPVQIKELPVQTGKQPVQKDIACNVILKSGAKKGVPCGRMNCFFHKKKEVVEVEKVEEKIEEKVVEKVEEKIEEKIVEKEEKIEKKEEEKKEEKKQVKNMEKACTALIKSGARKNQACDKLNCRMHKNVEEERVEIVTEAPTQCSRVLKTGRFSGKQCRHKPWGHHKTCFVHTRREWEDLDKYGYDTDIEISDRVSFCQAFLEHGKYKGHRCGNECDGVKNYCVLHSALSQKAKCQNV